MTELLKSRTKDPAIQELGNKIDVSQTDEMRWMKQWLTERGLPTSMDSMGGMDMSGMDAKEMEEHMKMMLGVRNKYDPHGGRAVGSREMLSKDSVAEYGGEMLYINKSAGKPLWAMEYSRDEGLRK